MLANLIVIIILQFIQISNLHVIYLKLTLYVNNISVKLGKKKGEKGYYLGTLSHILHFGNKSPTHKGVSLDRHHVSSLAVVVQSLSHV